jgi:hypothetical protein
MCKHVTVTFLNTPVPSSHLTFPDKGSQTLTQANQAANIMQYIKCVYIGRNMSLYIQTYTYIGTFQSHTVPKTHNGKGKGKVQPRTDHDGPEGE